MEPVIGISDQWNSLKAPNGIQWEVAHPLTLNYRAPIAYRDALLHSAKRIVENMCRIHLKRHRDGNRFFNHVNVNGWATSLWIPFT